MHRITIAAETIGTDAAWLILGHEIYHLVTAWNLTALRSALWVDEMLATQSSLELLRAGGRSQYADKVSEQTRASARWVTRAELERVHANTRWGWVRTGYPGWFPATVTAWGSTLRYVAGWDAMMQLAVIDSWEQWIASLPSEDQAAVSWLFGLEGEPRLEWLNDQAVDIDRRTAAVSLYLLGCDAVAAPAIEQVLSGDPTDTECLRYSASIAKARGDLNGQITAYRRLVKADHRSWIAYYNLANVLSDAGDHAEAVRSLIEANALNVTEPRVMYNLGVAYRKLGDMETAKRWWRAALECATGEIEPLIRRTLEEFR
jgi:tetratricopeptide (TPR) repeat protein